MLDVSLVSMKHTSLIFLTALLVCGCSHTRTPTAGQTVAPPSTFSGRYSNETLTYEFKGDRCFAYVGGKLASESTFYLKGRKLYISPNLADIPKMIRKAYCVFRVEGDIIIASHLEDVETGDRFETHLAGTLKLKKERSSQ